MQSAPVDMAWWFPVRRVRVSDEWSNAPGQLQAGDGVVRVEALGVTPEMIPPMPELTSPTAINLPHPEKRFAELTPQGPVSYVFWRWSIRPSNDTSAIAEPLTFEYFERTLREAVEVTISAQRVAYGTVVPERVADAGAVEAAAAQTVPGGFLAALAAVVFAGGLGYAQAGHRVAGLKALHRFVLFDPLARRLKRAARAGQLAEVRRAAQAILRADGASEKRRQLLAGFDRDGFAAGRPPPSLSEFVRAFL